MLSKGSWPSAETRSGSPASGLESRSRPPWDQDRQGQAHATHSPEPDATDMRLRRVPRGEAVCGDMGSPACTTAAHHGLAPTPQSEGAARAAPSFWSHGPWTPPGATAALGLLRLAKPRTGAPGFPGPQPPTLSLPGPGRHGHSVARFQAPEGRPRVQREDKACAPTLRGAAEMLSCGRCRPRARPSPPTATVSAVRHGPPGRA